LFQSAIGPEDPEVIGADYAIGLEEAEIKAPGATVPGLFVWPGVTLFFDVIPCFSPWESDGNVF
jgi:hypothetical protein